MSYSSNASDLSFEYIVKEISSGNWKPGMRIDTEEVLCDTLKVSRAAVRQAIAQLCALNVLNKIQGSGTYVNPFEEASLTGLVYYPPTVERMIQVLEFREQFDSSNADLFTRYATQEEIEALKENYQKMCEEKDNPEAFQLYENAFHNLIARGTHNVIIRQTSAMLDELLLCYQGLQYGNIGPDNSIIWHGRILEAILGHDNDMASMCCKTHLRNSIDYIKEHHASLQEYPLKAD